MSELVEKINNFRSFLSKIIFINQMIIFASAVTNEFYFTYRRIVKEEYHKWFTEYLEREFEMLVFGHGGYPLLLFPDAKGKFYQAKDEGLISSAANLIEEGKIKVYCPDSIDADSWYNWSIHPADRVKTHIGYENVILNDIIEFIKYDSAKEKIAVAGCGMGGYHAANLTFRHPDLFSHLISINGFFFIKQFIFGHYDDNCYFNNPPDYLPGLNDNWYIDKIRQIEILLCTGEHDLALEENINLSNILSLKNINHFLNVKPGFGSSWDERRAIFSECLERMIY